MPKLTTPELEDEDYRSLAELRFRLRTFLAFSESQARAVGLNPQQHQLLLAVRAFAPDAPLIGKLAERLILKHHSTVELVDRLERRGLVARVRASDDRRQARVELTRRGERTLRELSASHRDELRRSGPELIAALSALVRASRPRARHGTTTSRSKTKM